MKKKTVDLFGFCFICSGMGQRPPYYPLYYGANAIVFVVLQFGEIHARQSHGGKVCDLFSKTQQGIALVGTNRNGKRYATIRTVP
jgi:hypothetical protein